MKHSCGALLYSSHPDTNRIGIILGLEGWHWLPFKGCNEPGETFEQTAIREISEETCGLVQLPSIVLEHAFSSRTKHYHIGLCAVDYNIIKKFDKTRTGENRDAYIEKKKLRFFQLDEIADAQAIHNIARASIDYYWNRLKSMERGLCIDFNMGHMRNHSIGTWVVAKIHSSDEDCSEPETWRTSRRRLLNRSWRR